MGTRTGGVEGRSRSTFERREEAGSRWRAGRREQREGGEGWAERRNRRTPTKYGHLGEVENSGWGATNPRKEPRFGCQEDGRGERRRLSRTGMAVEHGTGDELDGNSMSRAE